MLLSICHYLFVYFFYCNLFCHFLRGFTHHGLFILYGVGRQLLVLTPHFIANSFLAPSPLPPPPSLPSCTPNVWSRLFHENYNVLHSEKHKRRICQFQTSLSSCNTAPVLVDKDQSPQTEETEAFHLDKVKCFCPKS